VKREIPQVRIRNQVNLESKGIKYQLWRLDDTEYQKLRDNSLPIEDDYKFYIDLDLSERDNKDRLNLAEIFITLEWVFGESSISFAEGKGSFSFPVLLILEKPTGTFYYLMDIADHRGTVYYRMYRLLENDIEGYENYRTREPFELEFCRQEINYFLSYLHGYISGCFEVVKLVTPVEPFFRKISSNLILYGRRDGEYFQEQHEIPEIFHASIKSLETELENRVKVSEISELLRIIISEN
jgi:hypothetical protein